MVTLYEVNKMDKKILACCKLAIMVMTIMLFQLSAVMAENKPADEWYWLSSDDKYSKYFDPESVVVTRDVQTTHGQVPTEINVLTKTSYSYAGAAETLQAYGLSNIFKNPNQLAFSVAQLTIKPQYRTVQYTLENFYDKNGNIIWSKEDPHATEKEINSQQFDEPFYTAAVDQAFHQTSEEDHAKAKNRWGTIFDLTDTDGVRIHTMADTSTMRMRGDNLIFWEWQETNDANGKVVEIKFQKMAVNLPQATEKVITGKYWTPQTNWQSLDESLDGKYRMIRKDSSEYRTIVTLREYVKENHDWVYRYALD